MTTSQPIFLAYVMCLAAMACDFDFSKLLKSLSLILRPAYDCHSSIGSSFIEVVKSVIFNVRTQGVFLFIKAPFLYQFLSPNISYFDICLSQMWEPLMNPSGYRILFHVVIFIMY